MGAGASRSDSAGWLEAREPEGKTAKPRGAFGIKGRPRAAPVLGQVRAEFGRPFALGCGGAEPGPAVGSRGRNRETAGLLRPHSRGRTLPGKQLRPAPQPVCGPLRTEDRRPVAALLPPCSASPRVTPRAWLCANPAFRQSMFLNTSDLINMVARNSLSAS